jgi:hypothetical protein
MNSLPVSRLIHCLYPETKGPSSVLGPGFTDQINLANFKQQPSSYSVLCVAGCLYLSHHHIR